MPKKASQAAAAVATRVAVAKASGRAKSKVRRDPIVAALENLCAAVAAEGATLQKVVLEDGEVTLTYEKTVTYKVGDPRIPI